MVRAPQTKHLQARLKKAEVNKESALRAVLQQQARVFFDTLKRVKALGLPKPKWKKVVGKVVSTLEPKPETREVATQTDVRLAPGLQPARLPKPLSAAQIVFEPGSLSPDR